MTNHPNRNRDMTRAEFNAALKRNGFANAFGGLWFRDTTGVCSEGHSFGAIFDVNKGVRRRATIAHLIRERAKFANTVAGRYRAKTAAA